MMLGKRQRNPFRRTTSMTRITIDMSSMEAPTPLDHQTFAVNEFKGFGELEEEEHVMMFRRVAYDDPTAMMSPRYNSRLAGDNQVEPAAHFLRKCDLCNRRLATGRDIYMYRGDTAFCSQECREERMRHEERNEKCKVEVSKNGENDHKNIQSQIGSTSVASQVSIKSDTIGVA